MEKVLGLLIEKKNYFIEQLVTACDADVKFGLQQKLKELEKEIAEYNLDLYKIGKKKDVFFVYIGLDLYKNRDE